MVLRVLYSKNHGRSFYELVCPYHAIRQGYLFFMPYIKLQICLGTFLHIYIYILTYFLLQFLHQMSSFYI